MYHHRIPTEDEIESAILHSRHMTEGNESELRATIFPHVLANIVHENDMTEENNLMKRRAGGNVSTAGRLLEPEIGHAEVPLSRRRRPTVIEPGIEVQER